MKHASLLMLAALLCLSTQAFSQNVVVNGVQDEDIDSSPRDDDGNIIGPETDNTFQTFYKAVEFLMEYNNGGTVTIAGPVSSIGTAYKPLTVVGANENSTFAGEIQMTGAELTIRNLKLVEGQFQNSAIFLEGGDLVMENVVLDQRGVQTGGVGEINIHVRDSVFINSKSNGIAAFGDSINMDVQNVEFKDFTAGYNKCLGIFPTSGLANVTVKDCTFTNGYLAIDDRHTEGEAVYQNLTVSGMSRLGINIEYDGLPNAALTGTTVIRDSVLDSCAYQAVHLHAQQNVTLDNVTVTNSGRVSFRDNDGAGIGGHDGCNNIVIEDCKSNDNQGHGYHFESDFGVTLRNNEALDNGQNGAAFAHCENITLENGNWLSGNMANGVRLFDTKDWKVQNNTIGLNRERNQIKANGLSGVALSNAGGGELGSTVDPIKGNVISGNDSAGVFLYFSEMQEAANVQIGSNYIGTDGQGYTALPNTIGIYINGNGAGTGIPLVQIGGRNPSMENPQNPDRGVGNVISGNKENGIHIRAIESDSLDQGKIDIWGNFIGTNAAGTDLLSNRKNGIFIEPNRYFEINIGTIDDLSKGNLISGNNENGVQLGDVPLFGMDVKKVRILNNLIGTEIDRESRSPNQFNGIKMSYGEEGGELSCDITENVVSKNVIHNNGENGILIIGEKAKGNHITENSIHRNDKKGIQLERDAQNKIKVALNHLIDSVTTVNKIFGKASEPKAKIEIFVDPTFDDANPGYWGQGKKYIRTIEADDEGKFEIDVDSIADLGMITVTASDDDKNTSEFSPFASLNVVQVVGKDSNMLVANKPTGIRVFANTGKGAASFDVTGELLFNDAPVEASPETFTMKPFGGYRASYNDRREAKSSLNHYVQIPPQGEREIEVTLKHNNEDRGKFKFGPYKFQRTRNLTMGVAYALAPVRAGGPPTVLPDLGLVRQAAEFFADVFPLDPRVFTSNYRILYPIFLAAPPHTNVRQKNMTDIAEAYRLLSVPPLNYVVAAVGFETYFEPPGSRWLVYGFTFRSVPNVVSILDGLKNRRPVLNSGDTLAHEIGHTTPFSLGDTYQGGTLRAKNPRDPSNSDVDGNFVLEDDFAFSPTGVFGTAGRRQKQAVFSDKTNRIYVYDIMGGSPPAWFDEKTYKIVFQEMGGVVGDAPAKAVRRQQETLASSLLVRGEIGLDDSVDFKPFLINDQPMERPTGSSAGDGYHADLLDANETVLDSQDFPSGLGVSEIHGENVDTGESIAGYREDSSFSFAVLLKNDPNAVRIEVKNGENLIGYLDKTPNDPTVSDVSGVESGAIPAEPFELSWNGGDPDPTDILYYTVLYTPDNGETIVPIAADLENIESITVYPQFLPSGPDPQFNVRVSDGWNQSDSASQTFSVADRAPTVSITEPLNDDRVSNEPPIILLGTAYDMEDGFLSDDWMEWYVDDGLAPIGLGARITVDLPLGQHTLKLIATDSAGNQGYAEVTIEVVLQGDTGVRQWRIHE